MTNIQDVLRRARLVEDRGPRPPQPPATLTQVDDHTYGLMVENVIGRTGMSHDEAERLVCAVLAPLLLAPQTPLPRHDNLHSDGDPFVLNLCGWALVQASGTTIYCDSGDAQSDDGKPLPHTPLDGDHYCDYAATSWNEDDPRAVHLPTWKGENEEDGR